MRGHGVACSDEPLLSAACAACSRDGACCNMLFVALSRKLATKSLSRRPRRPHGPTQALLRSTSAMQSPSVGAPSKEQLRDGLGVVLAAFYYIVLAAFGRASQQCDRALLADVKLQQCCTELGHLKKTVSIAAGSVQGNSR